jgi:DNA-damage-inducible protein D
MENTPHVSPFDAIRKTTDDGSEYWSARELYKLLGYSRWEKFQKSIEEAKIACENSGQAVADHFHLQVQLIKTGKGARRPTEDYHLTRYACYLIVQNADPNKPIVALGQTYFAYQTRRQEIADELSIMGLPKDQKRIMMRSMMSTFNIRLAETAQRAGVIEPSDFATFQDHGYMGLYEGRRENDIHAQKHLQPDEKILDFMGSYELVANMFRATQADAKMKRDQVSTKGQANMTHYRVGQEIRETIMCPVPECLRSGQTSLFARSAPAQGFRHLRLFFLFHGCSHFFIGFQRLHCQLTVTFGRATSAP